VNLHSIVAPVIGVVNTNESVTLYQNSGFTTSPDFSRTPVYATLTMRAQVQGLQSDDIRVLNGVGIQGERRKAYLWGAWTGMVRSLQKGNDLVARPDGSLWKVAYVFEDFGHDLVGSSGWCSVAIVLQNPEDGLPVVSAAIFPVPVDTRSAPQTYTLPTGALVQQTIIVVYDAYANARNNSITINGSGATVPPVINMNNGSIAFFWTGTSWFPF
jgi:hypothetical protein